ncbi:SpoIID/LytB domain-containing protein [Patescibacteria group bacterium]|nr:SpoIID/LytB domain-containing protein [Patescibacteria group bacterium]
MKTTSYIKYIVSILCLLGLLIITRPTLANTGYQAEKLAQSHAAIPELWPTQSIEFWVTFKNTGDTLWQGMGSTVVVLRTISGMKSRLTHSTWYDDYIPNRVNPVSMIFPGEEALFRFKLLAPRENGLYWEKFQLYAGSTPIPGGKIEFAIKVVGAEVTPPTTPEPQPEPVPPSEPTPTPPEPTETWWQDVSSEINIINDFYWTDLPKGPEIEVGLLYIEESEKLDYLPFQISTLDNKLYNIYDQNDKLLVRNTAGEIIEVDYDYELNRYFINDSQGTRILMSDSYFKLQGNNSTIFKIHSWKNGPFWGQNVNDNEFRDTLKIHYNPNTKRLWLINQLQMEEYLKGVAEVGDTSHIEFLKAQTIAARTYALFRYFTHKYTNTPDNQPFFTVMSTQADQVYRGYQKELRGPNALLATEQTKGIVATYQNNPILAYYFAQSDGYTRSSYETNMTKAPVDYLQPKKDPQGEGKTLNGHGVGLPQMGGITAANQGANYSQILKYYYTGIDLTKMY